MSDPHYNYSQEELDYHYEAEQQQLFSLMWAMDEFGSYDEYMAHQQSLSQVPSGGDSEYSDELPF